MNGWQRKALGWAATIVIALLAWGGTSLVSLLQRVSSVEAEQRGTTRWMEQLDGRLDRLDGKIDRLLRRALPPAPGRQAP